MSKKIYAAVDANINRAQEGVRVCEDIMRFNYSSAYAADLKKIRHKIKKAASVFPREFVIGQRDVSGDAQKFHDLESEKIRGSLEDIFMANLHRATEAVRCLEEFVKYTGETSGSDFQSIRFSLYEIEKNALNFIKKTELLLVEGSGVYAIIDLLEAGDEEAVETALGFVKGGAFCIQVNLDGLDGCRAHSVTEKLRAVCNQSGTVLIVNRLDILLTAGADGLLQNQNDVPPDLLKKIIPSGSITGIEVSDFKKVDMGVLEEYDFLLLQSVSDHEAGKLRKFLDEIELPVFIGGCEKFYLFDALETEGAVFPIVRSRVCGKSVAEDVCRKCINAWNSN